MNLEQVVYVLNVAQVFICKKRWLGKIQNHTEKETFSFMDWFVIETNM